MKSSATRTASNLDPCHESLLEDLKNLQETFDSVATLTSLAAGVRLAVMRSRLADHFGFDEQTVWMELLRKREPRFDHVATCLLREHCELTQSLDILIGEAEATQSVDEAFREQVRHWIARVRDHEFREDQLLEESANEDLGTGD